MKKLLIALLLFAAFSSDAQIKWGVKNYNFYPFNGIRIDSLLVLPDTLHAAPNGSVGYSNHSLWFKDTTWKQISGIGGSAYFNGYGLNLGGYTFKVDTSLITTKWYVDNGFYTKTNITAFFSGVSPMSGYNKTNWDNVYSAYSTSLTHGGWATQSALVDTAAAIRSSIGSGGGGIGDMTKAVYDANNNGVVDNVEGLSGKQNTLSGTGIVKSAGGTISYISDFSTDWNTAYSWGNHASAGYLHATDTSAMLSPYLRSNVAAATYQPKLVSATNIKTINGNSLLGSGDISISGGSESLTQVADISALQSYGGSETFLYVKDAKRGGFFEYTTSSLTDDNGIIFAATGKGSGHWKRRFDKAVGLNIEWYGAVGDGLTDNTTFIQNTVTSADAGGYRVYIPNGTFLSTGFNTGNMATTRVNEIYGNGDSSRLKITSDTSIITLTSHSIHIHDLSFVGSGTGSHQRAIRIPGWAYNQITNCNFQNLGRSGVYIDQQASTSGNVVSSNRFEGNGIGVETGTSGQYNSISNNIFYANDTAIYSFGTNNIINGNNISGNPSGNVGDGIIVKGDPATNNGKHIITNNNINHVTNAIQILDCPSFGNTIRSNHILVTSVALYVKNSINVNFDGNRVGGVTPYIRWEGSTGTFIGNQFYADLPQMDFAYNGSPSTVFRALTTTAGGVTTTASAMNYESDISATFTDRSMIDRGYADGRYILNQNSTSQTGNFRISGIGRMDGGLLLGGATSLGFDNIKNDGNGFENYGRFFNHHYDNYFNYDDGKTVIGVTGSLPSVKFIVSNSTNETNLAQFNGYGGSGNVETWFNDSIQINKPIRLFSPYINFNSQTGINGYGIRDSSGIMQFKNLNGAWTNFNSGGGGGGGSVAWTDIAGKPNSGNFIYNQNSSGQTANQWITGIGRFDGGILAGGATSTNGFDAYHFGGNGMEVDGRINQDHYDNYFNKTSGKTAFGYNGAWGSTKVFIYNATEDVALGISATSGAAYNFWNDSIVFNRKLVLAHPSGRASLQLFPMGADPTGTNPGDMWYNSTLGKYRANENGTVKDLIGSSGGGTTPTSLFAKLYASVTNVTTSGTSETDAYSFTIPAGTLYTNGDQIKYDLLTENTTSGQVHQINFYLGGVGIANDVEYTNGFVMTKVVITRTSSTTADVELQMWGPADTYGVPIVVQATGLDWSTNITSKFTMQAPTSGSITSKHVTVNQELQAL